MRYEDLNSDFKRKSICQLLLKLNMFTLTLDDIFGRKEKII